MGQRVLTHGGTPLRARSHAARRRLPPVVSTCRRSRRPPAGSLWLRSGEQLGRASKCERIPGELLTAVVIGGGNARA